MGIDTIQARCHLPPVKVTCPKCRHAFPAPQQRAAGAARAAGISTAERRAFALKAWATKRRNAELAAKAQ